MSKLGFWDTDMFLRFLDEDNDHHIPYHVILYKLKETGEYVPIYQVASKEIQEWYLSGRTEEERQEKIRERKEWIDRMMPSCVGEVEDDFTHVPVWEHNEYLYYTLDGVDYAICYIGCSSRHMGADGRNINVSDYL